MSLPSEFIKMQNMVNWNNRANAVVKPSTDLPKEEVVAPAIEPVIEKIPDVEAPAAVEPALEPLKDEAPLDLTAKMAASLSLEELVNVAKANNTVALTEVFRRARKRAKKLGIKLPDGSCTVESIDQFLEIINAEASM